MRRWVLSVLACCLVTGVVAPMLGGRPAGAGTPVSWGAHPEVRAGETEESAYVRLQATAGRQFSSVREFFLWNDAFPTQYENRLKADGTTLVMSVKSRLLNGTGVPWAEVAAAQPGSTRYAEMVRWVDRVRDYGAPVWFTFNHEPEAKGNNGLGTAADYRAAWQRWTALFAQEGDERPVHVDHDRSEFLAAGLRRPGGRRWYPGDDQVDGIAVDAYNWFGCRPGINNPWRSLQQIADPARVFAAAHPDEQFWVTEYATVEDAANPARKAQWYRDAQALFRTPAWAGTDGVLLFEPHPNSPCIWRPDSSAAALAAWRAWGADPYYGGTPAPARTAALVVGDPAAPGTDAGIADRLTARGYTVSTYDDNTVTVADVATATVVLISQSTGSGALGSRLRTLARPVLIWKPSLYDDMGLTPTESTSSSQTTATITAPAHPLAAGRTGTVTVLTSSTQLPVGDPTAGATVVATVAGRASLFVYLPGAPMSGLTAPACRVAVPMSGAGIPRLSTDGLALFDAAVDHAATNCT